MTIEFTCACGKRFRVPEDAAGKKGKCSACGAMNRVPDTGGGIPLEVEPEPKQRPASPTATATREGTATSAQASGINDDVVIIPAGEGGGAMKWILASAGGVVAIGLAIGIALLIVGDGPGTARQGTDGNTIASAGNSTSAGNTGAARRVAGGGVATPKEPASAAFGPPDYRPADPNDGFELDELLDLIEHTPASNRGFERGYETLIERGYAHGEPEVIDAIEQLIVDRGGELVSAEGKGASAVRQRNAGLLLVSRVLRLRGLDDSSEVFAEAARDATPEGRFRLYARVSRQRGEGGRRADVFDEDALRAAHDLLDVGRGVLVLETFDRAFRQRGDALSGLVERALDDARALRSWRDPDSERFGAIATQLGVAARADRQAAFDVIAHLADSLDPVSETREDADDIRSLGTLFNRVTPSSNARVWRGSIRVSDDAAADIARLLDAYRWELADFRGIDDARRATEFVETSGLWDSGIGRAYDTLQTARMNAEEEVLRRWLARASRFTVIAGGDEVAGEIAYEPGDDSFSATLSHPDGTTEDLIGSIGRDDNNVYAFIRLETVERNAVKEFSGDASIQLIPDKEDPDGPLKGRFIWHTVISHSAQVLAR